MHELPIVKSIFDICIKHATANKAKKILSVTLKVGELSDLQDQWIQRYFDFLNKGTIAEGARLVIVRIPLVVRCKLCSKSFQVNINERKQVECPRCNGTKLEYVSGREYIVENLEIV